MARIILLLQCPKCANKMKYQSRGLVSENKMKRCVYCGKYFKVRKSAVGKFT